MLTFKLVHLIQYHSDRLADGLLRQVRMSDRARSYCNVSPVELKDRVHDIYHHLGSWLLDKGESNIDQLYAAIGARRTEQQVPLSELVWVIVLTKNTLYKFVDDVSVPGQVADIAEKQELLQRLSRFFDEAIYATTVGYERAATERAHPPQASANTRQVSRTKGLPVAALGFSR
jgi:hypothetical protein